MGTEPSADIISADMVHKVLACIYVLPHVAQLDTGWRHRQLHASAPVCMLLTIRQCTDL